MSVIANCVSALKELRRLTFDEFACEHVLVGSAERDFQVAIQAALDIGASLLAELSVQVPTDYKDIFPKLAEIGILPHDFASKIVGMAKFRNVLVHIYLEIDLKKVYDYLQHELDDLELFAKYVSEYLSRA